MKIKNIIESIITHNKIDEATSQELSQEVLDGIQSEKDVDTAPEGYYTYYYPISVNAHTDKGDVFSQELLNNIRSFNYENLAYRSDKTQPEFLNIKVSKKASAGLESHYFITNDNSLGVTNLKYPMLGRMVAFYIPEQDRIDLNGGKTTPPEALIKFNSGFSQVAAHASTINMESSESNALNAYDVSEEVEAHHANGDKFGNVSGEYKGFKYDDSVWWQIIYALKFNYNAILSDKVKDANNPERLKYYRYSYTKLAFNNGKTAMDKTYKTDINPQVQPQDNRDVFVNEVIKYSADDINKILHYICNGDLSKISEIYSVIQVNRGKQINPEIDENGNLVNMSDFISIDKDRRGKFAKFAYKIGAGNKATGSESIYIPLGVFRSSGAIIRNINNFAHGTYNQIREIMEYSEETLEPIDDIPDISIQRVEDGSDSLNISDITGTSSSSNNGISNGQQVQFNVIPIEHKDLTTQSFRNRIWSQYEHCSGKSSDIPPIFENSQLFDLSPVWYSAVVDGDTYIWLMPNKWGFGAGNANGNKSWFTGIVADANFKIPVSAYGKEIEPPKKGDKSSENAIKELGRAIYGATRINQAPTEGILLSMVRPGRVEITSEEIDLAKKFGSPYATEMVRLYQAYPGLQSQLNIRDIDKWKTDDFSSNWRFYRYSKEGARENIGTDMQLSDDVDTLKIKEWVKNNVSNLDELLDNHSLKVVKESDDKYIIGYSASKWELVDAYENNKVNLKGKDVPAVEESTNGDGIQSQYGYYNTKLKDFSNPKAIVDLLTSHFNTYDIQRVIPDKRKSENGKYKIIQTDDKKVFIVTSNTGMKTGLEYRYKTGTKIIAVAEDYGKAPFYKALKDLYNASNDKGTFSNLQNSGKVIYGQSGTNGERYKDYQRYSPSFGMKEESLQTNRKVWNYINVYGDKKSGIILDSNYNVNDEDFNKSIARWIDENDPMIYDNDVSELSYYLNDEDDSIDIFDVTGNLIARFYAPQIDDNDAEDDFKNDVENTEDLDIYSSELRDVISKEDKEIYKVNPYSIYED